MSLSTSEHVLETLAIPKFKIEYAICFILYYFFLCFFIFYFSLCFWHRYGTELKDMLKEIGIKAAFSSKGKDRGRKKEERKKEEGLEYKKE